MRTSMKPLTVLCVREGGGGYRGGCVTDRADWEVAAGVTWSD